MSDGLSLDNNKEELVKRLNEVMEWAAYRCGSSEADQEDYHDLYWIVYGGLNAFGFTPHPPREDDSWKDRFSKTKALAPKEPMTGPHETLDDLEEIVSNETQTQKEESDG